MSGIEQNNNIEQQQSGGNSLDNFLDSELKLQAEIDKKLQNPDLQDIAREELEEIKTRFQESLDNVSKSTSKGVEDTSLESQSQLGDLKNNFALKDLVDDFKQDTKALSNLEKNYKNKKGYKEFVQLLKSNEVGEEEKEKLYTIFSNQESNKKLISRNLRKGFPLDKNSVDKFIKIFERKILNGDINDEITEIIDQKELETKSLRELIYMKDKLILLSGDANIDNEKEINEKLADLDINIDLKRKDLLLQETEEERQETEEERQETEEERQETEEEKQETEEEKQETEEERQENSNTTKIEYTTEEKRNNSINEQKNVLQNIENFPFNKLNNSDFKNAIGELTEAEGSKEIIKINENIADLLTKDGGKLLNKIMTLAGTAGKETYENIHSFISGIVNISGNKSLNESLRQVLKPYPEKYEEYNNTQKPNPPVLSGYFGNTGDVLKDGDRYFKGDMIIDLGEEPPIIDIFNKNTGYTLNIENIHSKEIRENAIVKQNVYGEMLDLKREEYKLQDYIQRSEDLLNNQEELEKAAKKEGKTTEELKIEIKSKIIEFEGDLLKVQKKYDKQRQKYIDLQGADFAGELKEQKEKQREVLKYLSAIGFDLIPQSVTGQFIKELQSNQITIPGLNLSSVQNIDLNEGKFGELENEANGDKWKDNLLKFTEKMIYGEINPEESIFRGQNFKGEMAASINPVEFYGVLDDKGLRSNSGWNINTLRDNLRNSPFDKKDPSEIDLNISKLDEQLFTRNLKEGDKGADVVELNKFLLEVTKTDFSDKKDLQKFDGKTKVMLYNYLREKGYKGKVEIAGNTTFGFIKDDIKNAIVLLKPKEEK